jgi:hypothetical protein
MVHQYISIHIFLHWCSWMDSRATDVDPFLTFVFPGLMMDDAPFFLNQL